MSQYREKLLGHIGGHFRDLFSVQFSRKTFRKMGSKCPMCPQPVLHITIYPTRHPGTLPPSPMLLFVHPHSSTGCRTKNARHGFCRHPSHCAPATPRLFSFRMEPGVPLLAVTSKLVVVWLPAKHELGRKVSTVVDYKCSKPNDEENFSSIKHQDREKVTFT